MTEDEVKNVEVRKNQIEKAQAFKRLFKTDDGKVLMKHLVWICNANKSTYRPNVFTNPGEAILVEEGKRCIYLDIIWYMNEGFLRKTEDD